MATRETLYVLQLEDGKYYVGKTTNLKRRVEEHSKGNGSEWTWTYRPVKVLESRPLKDDHDENNTTKNMMKKYGIENVRGGTYCQVELPKSYETALQAEICSAENSCFKCGGKGHFVRDCPVDCDVDCDDAHVWQCSKCTCEFSTERAAEIHEASCRRKRPHKTTCGRCGRNSHPTEECFANTHLHGYDLDSEEESSEDDDPPPRRSSACYRCGRAGHYASDCYASRHKKGYEID
jgi:predicted GIY-YIG superfamily endonuclease